MAHGRLLSLRLFLEGIEVACVSAQVSCGINQPASAQIEIPYAAAASKLLPRTLVHLFYCETTYSEGKVTPAGEAYSGIDTGDPQQWKLLFAGEVVSISFSKAGGARANYLMCQDFSSYWQAAQLYWGTGNNSANAYKKILFMGGTQITTGAKKIQNGGMLADLLAAKPSSIPTLPGILGGVVTILEAASGVYNSDKKYRGVNDFLSQAEVRLHLSRLIAAHPEDDTSETFLNYGDLKTYFRRVTASVSSTSSFMDVVNIFMSKIHHVWASVAAPPFMKEGMKVKVAQSLPANKVANFDKELGEWTKKIQATRDAIDLRLQEAGRNKLKDDNAGNYALVENKSKESNTLKVEYQTDRHKAFVDKVASIGLYDGQDVQKGVLVAESTNQSKIAAYADKITAKLNATRPNKTNTSIAQGLEKAREAIADLRTIATKNDKEVYENHTSDNLVQTQKKLDAALEALSKGTSIPMVVKYKTVSIESRLAMFLFMPDLFMVPPPKCNVLFPDHYMSVSFGRAWLNEPTRVWLFGQTSAGSETSTGYFSPNTSILSGPKAADAATAASNGTSFLMKHEIFSGPVPVLESIGDMGVFKRLHKKQLADSQNGKIGEKKKVADPLGSEFTGQARYSPQEHMQRAANYLFFAKRFATRSMNINAKFCPQIVPGLPMLVLDPPTAESSFSTSKKPTADIVGQHYVGLVAQVQHTIQTNGASTSIQLIKCRYHNEGLDLFQQKEGDLNEDTGTLNYAKRVVTYKKKSPAKIGKIGQTYDSKQMLDEISDINGPGDGYIESNVVYTQENSNTEGSGAPYQSKTTTWRNAKTGKEVTVKVSRIEDVKTPIGYTQLTAGAPYMYEGGRGPVIVPAFEVSTYSPPIAVNKQKPLNFTFEATSMPPWFANIYLPSKIGPMFYEQILGCRSILDDPLISSKAAVADDETFAYKVKTASGTREVKLPSEFKDPAMSTHQAAEQLADVWKGLQEIGANLPLFVDTYTERNHATMYDVMGTANPWFRPKFTALEDRASSSKVRGFHGDAFGKVKDMLSPVTGAALEETPTVPRMPSTTTKPPTLRKISPAADPREARYTRIEEYEREVSKIRTAPNGLLSREYKDS